MKILIAMDSYKGSITSVELVELIGRRIEEKVPGSIVYKVPIADGGEGTIEALNNLDSFDRISVNVHDPLMREIKSYYVIKDNAIAIVEMAKCSGLTLLSKQEMNPMETTTFGVGEIIKDALDKDIKNFIIGIGGSATNDGGIGMLQALGMKFYDENNLLLEPVGKSLGLIRKIDSTSFDQRIKNCNFMIASDVDNPLIGTNGAAYVYAPQKGASKEMIKELDNGLMNYAKIVKSYFNKDFATAKGAGAAGGLGYALLTFFNGQLKSGVELIFDQLNLEEISKNMDLIITGEGRIDSQSKMGKVLSGVGRLGIKYNIPVIAIAGGISDEIDSLEDIGITSIFSIINQPMSLEKAMEKTQTEKMLLRTVDAICNLIK